MVRSVKASKSEMVCVGFLSSDKVAPKIARVTHQL